MGHWIYLTVTENNSPHRTENMAQLPVSQLPGLRRTSCFQAGCTQGLLMQFRILPASHELCPPCDCLTVEHCKIIYAPGMINYEIMLVANNQHLESYNLPSVCHIACAVHDIASLTTLFSLGFYVHYSFIIPFYKEENSAYRHCHLHEFTQWVRGIT